MKYLLMILCLFASSFVKGQTFVNSFKGCWGDTVWEFHFKENGKFSRISSGHYGFTTVEGKYSIQNDTIQIHSGYKDTHGTVNEFYIVDENDVLIDADSGYGHPLLGLETDAMQCELQYPNIRAVNKVTMADVETVLNLAFNADKMRAFYHFDKLPARKLIVANYHKLNAKIKVDGREAQFQNREDISDEFFIEFEEIHRYYDVISFKVKIQDEGAAIQFIYTKENSVWKEFSIQTVEN